MWTNRMPVCSNSKVVSMFKFWKVLISLLTRSSSELVSANVSADTNMQVTEAAGINMFVLWCQCALKHNECHNFLVCRSPLTLTRMQPNNLVMWVFLFRIAVYSFGFSCLFITMNSNLPINIKSKIYYLQRVHRGTSSILHFNTYFNSFWWDWLYILKEEKQGEFAAKRMK